MKATGIVRKVDNLGRIVLPKELRQTFGIAEGDPLEIFTNGDQIVLKKYAPGCTLCGTVEDLSYVKGKPVCRACVELTARLAGKEPGR
ncbi:AbrB/MazE/SpoVT family DNA-binding domain-containing protein [Paenibacillus alkalitolerans]|uniref:AbrB/MazE/SpoVT family DNA-binding domain-containing protein n=1 Tax=Paenibacillus alkalitolerans TaxID=2799335 RepID=UPI0018F33479|nr:AbrB/MazE/SpoVT family DNA-binding domain-containing protein [Paenibacillus alkalitolerans]